MMRRRHFLVAAIGAGALQGFMPLPAIESERFRLLSLSTSTKMILVSQIPSKKKLLLDASAAKVTVRGKPAEFKALQTFTVVRVRFELAKAVKEGVEIDGKALEIAADPTDVPR